MNQDKNQQNEIAYAMLVAFDWADQKHAGAWCTADGRVHSFELDQTPQAIDEWATSMRERSGGQQIAVCLEQSKGALIYGLLKYEFIDLYPINPKQLKKFRDTFALSGAKDDPTDAQLLLELLLKHRDRLRRWKPDNETTRLLGMLVEDRRELVHQRTAMTNALKSRLKQYFPLALEVVGELDTELACRFLLRWNCLEDLKKEDPAEVEAFYREHHCHNSELIAERLERIVAAKPLTVDSAIVGSGCILVRSLTAQILPLQQSIRQYDDQIVSLMNKHPDAQIFKSFPGAGEALAPRLLVAFGTDRDRLQSAEEMECISGIAPVTIKSGKSKYVQRRLACNKFLRQTFHEFAQHTLAKSTWAKAYYDMKRDKGVKHHAAIRALAFKWIRILYTCWKNRTLYNELHYVAKLIKKRSPLLEFINSST